MESQRTPNSQNNFEKERVEGLTLSDFKTYYKAIIWYWNKDKKQQGCQDPVEKLDIFSWRSSRRYDHPLIYQLDPGNQRLFTPSPVLEIWLPHSEKLPQEHCLEIMM